MFYHQLSINFKHNIKEFFTNFDKKKFTKFNLQNSNLQNGNLQNCYGYKLNVKYIQKLNQMFKRKCSMFNARFIRKCL